MSTLMQDLSDISTIFKNSLENIIVRNTITEIFGIFKGRENNN